MLSVKSFFLDIPGSNPDQVTRIFTLLFKLCCSLKIHVYPVIGSGRSNAGTKPVHARYMLKTFSHSISNLDDNHYHQWLLTPWRILIFFKMSFLAPDYSSLGGLQLLRSFWTSSIHLNLKLPPSQFHPDYHFHSTAMLQPTNFSYFLHGSKIYNRLSKQNLSEYDVHFSISIYFECRI